ncbi:MAG TPA: hypothetical protein VGB55_08145 [Tepidisphaeraceae bacterium]|jgi:hypothetical protein
MLYETASEILNSFPVPRVRVTLVTGEVLETPGPLMAGCNSKICSVSTDGHHARVFRWSEIAAFERLPDHKDKSDG